MLRKGEILSCLDIIISRNMAIWPYLRTFFMVDLISLYLMQLWVMNFTFMYLMQLFKWKYIWLKVFEYNRQCWSCNWFYIFWVIIRIIMWIISKEFCLNFLYSILTYRSTLRGYEETSNYPSNVLYYIFENKKVSRLDIWPFEFKILNCKKRSILSPVAMVTKFEFYNHSNQK